MYPYGAKRPKLDGTTQALALSTSAERSTLLAPGRYRLACAVASAGATGVNVLQGGSDVEATTDSPLMNPAGPPELIYVEDETDGYISAILDASTGRLTITKMGEL